MQQTNPTPLFSRNCRLRPVLESDVPLLHEWSSDWALTGLWEEPSAEINQFRLQVARMLAGTYTFLVERRRDRVPVGITQLYNVSPRHGWAFYMVYLTPTARRSLFAVESGLLLLGFAFSSLDLRKVYADVYEFNDLAHRTLLSAGFREEGRFREFLQLGDSYWDCHRLSLTRSGWLRAAERLRDLADVQTYIDDVQDRLAHSVR